MAHYLPHIRYTLDRADCPLPDSIVFSKTRIKLGVCPAYRHLPKSQWVSCYDVETDTIWLNTEDWHNDFALYHECGHVFDLQHLTDEDRKELRRIMKHPGLRWFWRNWNPITHWKQPNMENFADTYAEACLYSKKHFEFRRYLRMVVARGMDARMGINSEENQTP